MDLQRSDTANYLHSSADRDFESTSIHRALQLLVCQGWTHAILWATDHVNGCVIMMPIFLGNRGSHNLGWNMILC